MFKDILTLFQNWYRMTEQEDPFPSFLPLSIFHTYHYSPLYDFSKIIIFWFPGQCQGTGKGGSRANFFEAELTDAEWKAEEEFEAKLAGKFLE